MNRFAWSAWALLALGLAAVLAAPPTLVIPDSVRPAGDYATFTPKGDSKSITYVGLSGVDAFPSELLRDGRTFVLPVRGLKDGVYRFAAVASSTDGEQLRVDFTVTVGGGGGTTPDPKDPPAQPTGNLFFVIVRGDGAATPEFTKLMSDPGWDALRRAGHSVKDFGYSESCRTLGLCLQEGTRLPVVFTLRVSPDGKTSRVVRTAIPVPTTTQGITDLVKGVQP